MTKIPAKLLAEILANPFYKTCAKHGQYGHQCNGRITFEHSMIYAGKQLQVKFAIIPLCAFGHSVDQFQDGGDLDKEMNLWIALSRATDAELRMYSKAINYERERNRLNSIYGEYKQIIPAAGAVISSPQPKKIWYPVSDGQKLMVNRCIDHFIDKEGIHYTPFRMIERMIVDFTEDIDRLDAGE